MKKVNLSKGGSVWDSKVARHNVQQLQAAAEVKEELSQYGSSRLHEGSLLARVEGTDVKRLEDGALVFEHAGKHLVVPSPPEALLNVMGKLEGLFTSGEAPSDAFFVSEIPGVDAFTKICIGEALCQFRIAELVGEMRLPHQSLTEGSGKGKGGKGKGKGGGKGGESVYTGRGGGKGGGGVKVTDGQLPKPQMDY